MSWIYPFHKYKYLIKVIVLLLLVINIKSEITDCSRDKPILISGECKLDFCSEEQFNNSDCLIANSIVETQWLNNIIIFGDEKFRYINFGTYSNGDMIVGTSQYPNTVKRMFFGLNQNGRPLFEVTAKESTYYKTLESDSTVGLFESESFIIKLTSSETAINGKEYFIVIGKLENTVEIYDFDNNKVYDKTLQDFTSIPYVKSLRHGILLFPSTSEYYYLFAFIGGPTLYGTDNSIYFQKHIFNTLENFKTTNTYNSDYKTKNNAYGKQISCFITDSNYIICFYLTKSNNVVKFNLHKYDINLSNEKILTITSSIDNENLFCKSIHFKQDIGIFSSYCTISNIQYPFLLIREFSSDNFVNYLSSSNSFDSSIMIGRGGLSTNVLLNDIVKMNNNKIVFTSTSESKEILYIVVVHFFGEKQYRVRYYDIPIFALYHYKFLFELRLNNYNNFLSFSSSICPNENCSTDDDEHYSSLIIFSYPNSTDVTFSLDNYLFNNNNISIQSVEFSLNDQLIFENNIFGYVLSTIIISEIGPGPEYELYSSKDESKKIEKNSILENDENIKLK